MVSSGPDVYMSDSVVFFEGQNNLGEDKPYK